MELLQHARALYDAGRLRDALEAAQAACDRAPRSAEAWWLLARVSRHNGMPQASEQAFRRAHELSRAKPVPYRVSRTDFEAVVADVTRRLSPDAARRLASTRVEAEDLPSEEEIAAGVRPGATARRTRRPDDRLRLYQANLEDRAATAAELAAEVEKVLSRA